ncbi:MAG: hypothetical protein WA981_07755 [Glaciecola sp.]
MKDNVAQMVSEICTADTLKCSLDLYDKYEKSLTDYRFIFASKAGSAPGFSVNRNFSDGSVVRSLFNTPSIIVLDKDINNAMKKGKASYRLDYSISLDTQALSYLEPYINGRFSKLPRDFEEIFHFIAHPSVNIDPLPYLQENLFNLSDPKKASRIFDKIVSYEILRTIDIKKLKTQNTVASVLTLSELANRAQTQISRLFRDISDNGLMQGLKFSFNFMYWHLLAMVSIEFSHPTLTTERKLEMMFSLCDKTLATLSTRELTLAKHYFDKGQKLDFFGKIQKKSPKLFDTLEGMAWDMWHIRQIEKNFTIRPDPASNYFIPSLLTCDKRLVEIIELYPIKSIAYTKNSLSPMPYFDGDWIGSLSSDERFNERLYLTYFSESARLTTRAQRRNTSKSLIKNSTKSLEKSICEIAKIERDPSSIPSY